jgi:hypothetical protein
MFDTLQALLKKLFASSGALPGEPSGQGFPVILSQPLVTRPSFRPQRAHTETPALTRINPTAHQLGVLRGHFYGVRLVLGTENLPAVLTINGYPN